MDKEFSLFCSILDRSHVLMLLDIKKDLSGVAEVAPASKIILMTVRQISTNVRFSRDNDFNTLATSCKWLGSHSKIVGII